MVRMRVSGVGWGYRREGLNVLDFTKVGLRKTFAV